MKTQPRQRRLVFAGSVVFALAVGTLAPSAASAVSVVDVWSDPVTINNVATFSSPLPGGGGNNAGTWGSEYPRLEPTGANRWVAVYTKSVNQGYPNDPNGGLQLEIATSTDNARTWSVRSTISAAGRDLDNGQILRLSDGTLLLAARSVRWQESYQLPVYRSTDGGATWSYLSTIDQNNGTPGSLGSPDRGMYEPMLFQLPDGRVSVVYANEKHVTETPAYSQVISQRTSADNGATWGSETYAVNDTASSASRPGMPVIDRMRNDSYILTYEVCGGSYGCAIHQKTSTNGTTWAAGLGTSIPGQSGAPFVTSLRDGRIVVTSNASKVSVSNNYGSTWNLMPASVWPGTFPDYEWNAIYQTGDNEIAVAGSVVRAVGGHNIQIKFGALPQSFEAENAAVINDAAIRNGYSTASQQSFVGAIDNAGSYVEFQRINVSQGGTYRLSVSYANGSGVASTHGITVNGTSAGTLSYPATSGWGLFPNVVSRDVNLTAGDNTIRFTKGTSFAEIDQISVARYEGESAKVVANRFYGVGVSPSGAGYVGGIDTSGNYVEYRGVNALVAGTYTLRVRYADGGAAATHGLVVNGSSAGSVSYAPTAGWGQFATTSVTVTLAAGANTIRFDKGTNFAEIDYIEVYR